MDEKNEQYKKIAHIHLALDAVARNLSQLRNLMVRLGDLPQSTKQEFGYGTIGYHLQKARHYTREARAGYGYVYKLIGDLPGKTCFCPYDDCRHKLEIYFDDWFVCGHCGKPFIAIGFQEKVFCRLPADLTPPEELFKCLDRGSSKHTPPNA